MKLLLGGRLGTMIISSGQNVVYIYIYIYIYISKTLAKKCTCNFTFYNILLVFAAVESRHTQRQILGSTGLLFGLQSTSKNICENMSYGIRLNANKK